MSPLKGFSRFALAGLSAAVLSLCAACTGQPDTDSSEGQEEDLVAGLALARARSETQAIDLTEASSSGHKLLGWTPPRKRGKGSLVSYTLGKRAVVEFFVAEPADRKLRLRCSKASGIPEQSVRVLVNDTAVGTHILEKQPSEISAAVPAEAFRLGANQLTLQFASARGLDDLPLPRSGLALSAACESVEFDTRFSEAPPDPPDESRESPLPEGAKSALDGTALFIPFGHMLEYHFVAQGGQLEFGPLTTDRPATGGRLLILWEEAGGSQTTLAAIEQSLQPTVIELPQGGRPGRLTLIAQSSDTAAASAATGLLIDRPRRHHATNPRTAEQPGTPTETDAELRPNILIYLVDTLRADHLGVYGYPRRTSPHLDEFARSALVFDNAQAQSPWTRASVASIVTGLWPQLHGANDDADGLPPELTTLAEHLREKGYSTRGFLGNRNAGSEFGFARGYEVFEDISQQDSHKINKSVFRWLDERQAQDDRRPFLAYVHTIDPHVPYDPPAKHLARFLRDPSQALRGPIDSLVPLNQRQVTIDDELIDYVTDLYDAEIASNDAAFGKLLRKLDSAGLSETTAIFFVSDHGEELYDHGAWSHGRTLYQEQLDVPLLMRIPGSTQPRHVPHVVQHVDLFATVLELAGIDLSQVETQGRSLLAFLDSDPPPGTWPERSVSYMNLRGRVGTAYVERAEGHGANKIIELSTDGHPHFPMLFDRLADRTEQENTADRSPILAAYLASRWRRELMTAGPGYQAAEVDLEQGDLRQQLEALGYLQ